MLPMPILSVLDQSPIRSGGSPAQAIRETLEDELVIVSIAHEFKARLRSYELLAEAFDLPQDDTD
jgi:hypothetical protein